MFIKVHAYDVNEVIGKVEGVYTDLPAQLSIIAIKYILLIALTTNKKNGESVTTIVFDAENDNPVFVKETVTEVYNLIMKEL